MFVFGCVLTVLGLLCGISFMGAATDSVVYDEETRVCYIIGFFCILIAILGLVICWFTYVPPLCPGCHTEVSANVRYCEACGYELIPHCIDCGEICRTAFCELCGAEQ